MTQHEASARFPLSETHRSAWPTDRLIVHSGERSWRNLYVSLAHKEPWKATLPAVDHHCIAYCVSQTASVTRTVDGEAAVKATLGPRRFGMIPASVPSHWDVVGSPEILLIYIRKSLFDQVAADVLDRDIHKVQIIPTLGTSDGLLEQLALAVLSELRYGNFGNSLYADILASAMIAQLLQRHSSEKRAKAVPECRSLLSRPGLRRTLDYIDASLAKSLGIEELAKIAGLNPVYFARSFRHGMGVSPHQYVLERRIEKAKTLLATSDVPLVDVALQTGFSSQSHFSTTFMRVVGVTPKSFRCVG